MATLAATQLSKAAAVAAIIAAIIAVATYVGPGPFSMEEKTCSFFPHDDQRVPVGGIYLLVGATTRIQTFDSAGNLVVPCKHNGMRASIRDAQSHRELDTVVLALSPQQPMSHKVEK